MSTFVVAWLDTSTWRSATRLAPLRSSLLTSGTDSLAVSACSSRRLLASMSSDTDEEPADE
jgi:hypothetical protein